LAAGRIAARRCLTELGLPGPPLLRHRDGSPVWPRTARGSITHKGDLCLVVAAAAGTVSGLGLDLEESAPLPELVWPLVLSAGERERHVASGGPLDPGRSRLVLCAKEAFYKWSRSVGGEAPEFHDVTVDADGDNLLFDAAGAVPQGRFVLGSTWTVAVVWSKPGAGSDRPVEATVPGRPEPAA
jgi:4'-phosphopantetheinyl transferase EntD